MSYNYLPLDETWLSFQQVKDLLDYNQHVSITADAYESISKCREYLDKKMKQSDELFYGINTGFGFLQNVQIDNGQIEQFLSSCISFYDTQPKATHSLTSVMSIQVS